MEDSAEALRLWSPTVWFRFQLYYLSDRTLDKLTSLCLRFLICKMGIRLHLLYGNSMRIQYIFSSSYMPHRTHMTISGLRGAQQRQALGPEGWSTKLHRQPPQHKTLPAAAGRGCPGEGNRELSSGCQPRLEAVRSHSALKSWSSSMRLPATPV